MSDTAKNIKRLRLAKGMTQEKLADLMDKHKTTVSNWERGENLLNVGDIARLCSILGVDANTLLGWKSEEEKESGVSDIMVNGIRSDLMTSLVEMSEFEQKRLLRLAKAMKDGE